MGVIYDYDGWVKPICNDCGIALCWSLDEVQYIECKPFWDNWMCEDCCSGNQLPKMSVKTYKDNVDKLNSIAKTLSVAPIIVNQAYQAYQLVKEQSNDMLWITDTDIAIAVYSHWPHLFAESDSENDN